MICGLGGEFPRWQSSGLDGGIISDEHILGVGTIVLCFVLIHHIFLIKRER